MKIKIKTMLLASAIGVMLAGASVSVLADRLFGYETSASSDAQDMNVRVDALFRPQDGGNGLIAELPVF